MHCNIFHSRVCFTTFHLSRLSVVQVIIWVLLQNNNTPYSLIHNVPCAYLYE